MSNSWFKTNGDLVPWVLLTAAVLIAAVFASTVWAMKDAERTAVVVADYLLVRLTPQLVTATILGGTNDVGSARTWTADQVKTSQLSKSEFRPKTDATDRENLYTRNAACA